MAVVLLASTCGTSSPPVTSSPTPASSPTASSLGVGVVPTSTGTGSTASPSSGLLDRSTDPIFPLRREPGEPEIRCSISNGLLGPNDAAPEASASDLLPFSFPPANASAQDRPVTDADIAGFIAAFAVLRGVPTTIPFVVVPGSARVAYIPLNGQHWGLASFSLPPDVPIDRKVVGGTFDPPRNTLAFVRPPGCPWSHTGNLSDPFPCPKARLIPEGVQEAWRLQSPPKQACDNLVRQTR